MAFSPNLRYSSPLLSSTGWTGSTPGRSILESPSDSRVPRTPHIERRSVVLDQSVPLTPVGMTPSNENYDSPTTTTMRVPSTPEGTRLMSDTNVTPSMAPFIHPMIQDQALSCSSTPCRSDQLVPSTPTNLSGVKRNMLLREELLSPVPHCSPTPNSRSVSDSQLDLFWSADVSMDITPASTSTKSNEESGYVSTSSISYDGTDSSSKKNMSRGSEIFPSSPVPVEEITKKEFPMRPRKHPPPSRRRLSLCKHGNQDVMRRTANHNLAVQRYSSGSIEPTTSYDILDSSDDAGPSVFFKHVTPVALSLEKNKDQLQDAPKPVVKPLQSPAGDADCLLTYQKGKRQDTCMKNDRNKDMTGSASSSNVELSDSKTKDILDVCD